MVEEGRTCFMATEDKAILSAAIKAMQETEVAEAAATKVKDKATKLLKEENKAKRETEIKSIVVGTQKAWKAAEKAQSLAIEAALSAANVSPVAVATKFIEEDNKAAKKVQDASQRPRERPPKASRCLLTAPRKAVSKLIGSLMLITATCSYCKC